MKNKNTVMETMGGIGGIIGIISFILFVSAFGGYEQDMYSVSDMLLRMLGIGAVDIGYAGIYRIAYNITK